MQAIVQFQLAGRGGTPSNVDGTSNTRPHDFGSHIMSRFADAGVTDWLREPPTRAQNLGNGYDVKTLYDYGDLSPTRYGTRQSCYATRPSAKRTVWASAPMRCSRIATAARARVTNFQGRAVASCACRSTKPASSTRTRTSHRGLCEARQRASVQGESRVLGDPVHQKRRIGRTGREHS
jgi:hypothetical protein